MAEPRGGVDAQGNVLPATAADALIAETEKQIAAEYAKEGGADENRIRAYASVLTTLLAKRGGGPVSLNLGTKGVYYLDPAHPNEGRILSGTENTKADADVRIAGNYVIVTDPKTGVVQRNLIDPTKKPEGVLSQEQTDAAATAGTAHVGAQTGLLIAQAGALETPTERAAARNAATRAAQDLLVAQYEASGKNAQDLERLRSDLQRVQDDHNAEIRAIDAQVAFDREKPYKDAASQIASRQAATQEEQNVIARQNAAALDARATADRQQVQNKSGAEALQTQGKGFQDIINNGIKLGIAPTAGLVGAALDPFAQAFALINQGVQQGQIPSSYVPTPKAPTPGMAAPTAAPTAPVPTQVSAPVPAGAMA